jgi:dTMP kinase
VTDDGGGRLIAFEGIDGCGKSTQAALLADRLGALLTFEPGATGLGAAVRRLLLDADQPPVADRAEVLLLLADRAQHVAEVLGPALAAGTWVVTDRFSGSTLAYQGSGRGLDGRELERLAAWSAGGVRPDLTVLVDVPVSVAAARRAADRPDRFERLGSGFHQRVAEGFRDLAVADPGTWTVVDGTGPVDAVAAAVWSAVEQRWPDRG